MAADLRIDAILGAPPELAAFARWLDGERRATGGERRDYLFLEGRPRFEPRREDVAVALPGLSVERQGGDAVVVAAMPGAPAARIPIAGVPPKSAEKLLAAIDGRRTLLEARWHAELAPEIAAKILRGTFGLVVLAPAAIQALEARVPSVEIVRYPTSPYAIERAYWENAADVRERAIELRGRLLGDTSSFREAIRELHVVQILGARLDRFYRPASPSTDAGVDPGALHFTSPRILEREGGPAVFLDGIRVLAPAVGGARAFAALAASVGDTAAIAGERAIVDEGLAWGRVAMLRGDGDDAAKLWFVPPRPMQGAHWEALHEAFRATCEATERDDVVSAAARFHARFVRLHPFRCANQSIAMSLVNAALSRVAGCGIPHLALDHLALRLDPRAYERAFARAVSAFTGGPTDPALRLAMTRTRSRAALAFCDELERCPDDDAAQSLIGARPDVASWALVR